jgi:hypothetical protein
VKLLRGWIVLMLPAFDITEKRERKKERNEG